MRNADEEAVQPGEYDRIICRANSRVEPNPRIYAAFQALSENRLPENSVTKETSYQVDTILDEAGNLKTTPPPSFLPTPLQDFISEIERKLSEATKKTVGLLRWRGAIVGPYNPLLLTGSREWSFDGEKWYTLPYDIHGRMEMISSTVHVFDHVRAEIDILLAEGNTEPLGHELFREAWADA